MTDRDAWEAREDFKTAQPTVAAVRAVNDCAERAVKLATDYNMALTHDEEHSQLIFQVVEHHRGCIAAPLKRKFAEVDDKLLPETLETAHKQTWWCSGAVNITFIMVFACNKTTTAF